MQVIRALDAILLRARETELAPPANPTREPNPNQPADFQRFTMRDTRAERNDAPNSLVPAYVRQLDLRDRVPIRSRCSTGFRVEVCNQLMLLDAVFF